MGCVAFPNRERAWITPPIAELAILMLRSGKHLSQPRLPDHVAGHAGNPSEMAEMRAVSAGETSPLLEWRQW
jgi:hypothetical protein